MRFRIFAVIFFISLILSCSDDEGPSLSAYQMEVISYFKEVALGFEFGTASEITRKWTGPMKIFVGGEADVEMMNELQDIISEINDLSSDGFEISIIGDTLQSNCYIFFGSGEDFAEIFPPASSAIATNWGLFYVYFSGNDLYKAVIYVDTFRASELNARKHLLREELTQSLGFGKDSFKYPASIFQQSWTTTTEYVQIDRDLIRLLYHPDMYSGLDEEEVDPVLRSIIQKLQIGI